MSYSNKKIFIEAGAAEGLYTNLMISGKRSSALISDIRIKGGALTGSEAAAASVAESAGKNLKSRSLN